nr:uncharacterized protein LOC100438649 isoform X1 [Pongo abelii]
MSAIPREPARGRATTARPRAQRFPRCFPTASRERAPGAAPNRRLQRDRTRPGGTGPRFGSKPSGVCGGSGAWKRWGGAKNETGKWPSLEKPQSSGSRSPISGSAVRLGAVWNIPQTYFMRTSSGARPQVPCLPERTLAASRGGGWSSRWARMPLAGNGADSMERCFPSSSPQLRSLLEPAECGFILFLCEKRRGLAVSRILYICSPPRW